MDTNIFVTTTYSIENYLVTKNMFSRCLRELMGLDNDKKNSVLVKGFRVGLETFYEANIILSAYILYHRKNGTSLNLQDITFSDVFTISDEFIVCRKKGIHKLLDRKTGANSAINLMAKIIHMLRKSFNIKCCTGACPKTKAAK